MMPFHACYSGNSTAVSKCLTALQDHHHRLYECLPKGDV